MNRKYGLLVVIGLLATSMLASEVQAQPGGGGNRGQRGMGMMGGMGGRGGMGGGTGLQLLQNEQVQKELEIVADQKTKITELATEQRTARQDMMSQLQDLQGEERVTKMQELSKKSQEKLDKKLAEILLPKQLERLKELQIQAEGAAALMSNQDVIKALNVTSEQQEKMRAAQQELMTKMRDAMQGGGMDPQEMQANMQKMTKELNEKLLALLTPDQAAKFEKMKGAKSDIDFTTIGRGQRGQRGQRGGGGGPGGN
jgi:hypothetical protein